MKSAIGTREIICVSTSGATLQGTYHKVRSRDRTLCSAKTSVCDIGVIFVSGGYRPRSGEGDTGVYWADSLAGSGYPCFRFDLPGYGDSPGDVPSKLFDWLNLVNTGYYGPILADTTREIIERFQLYGSVIIGHCSGANSAIYAAATTPDIKGVVLLEPYFHCEREDTRARLEFREWVTRNRVAGLFSRAYDRLKYRDRLREHDRLPGNANLQLLGCLEQLIARELPILILKAPAMKVRLGEFDYLGYLRRRFGTDFNVTVETIEGTSHSFAKGPGKAKVREAMERWLAASFYGGANDSVNPWKPQSAVR